MRTGTDAVAGDVWIDDNENILSANSANQALGGFNNVILGYRAFADDAGVTDNMIAIGVGAAQHDTTTGDARNIAIGYQAAMFNGGTNVTFMGREAGMNNTGHNVIGIGDYAGYDNEGNGIVALGERAAQENSQWAVNALGNSAAQNNSGYGVNALEPSAAKNNSGDHVNAMGYEAAYHNNGNHAVAIGYMSLHGNITGTEGEGNIGIGYAAGFNIGTGAYNIAIGHDTQYPDGNHNNQINIGNNIIRNEEGVISLYDLIQLPALENQPANPADGMIYFDGTMLYCYANGMWNDLW